MIFRKAKKLSNQLIHSQVQDENVMLMCFFLGIYNIRVALIKIFLFRKKMSLRSPNRGFHLVDAGTRDKFLLHSAKKWVQNFNIHVPTRWIICSYHYLLVTTNRRQLSCHSVLHRLPRLQRVRCEAK